jgi:hypothetical protein
VAGDSAENGAVDGQPTPRIRPHWWAVLAVSVSLLALVAANSGHPHPTGGRAADADESANPPQSRSTAPAPTTATTTTTQPGPGTSTVTPPTSPTPAPTTSATEGTRAVGRALSAPTTTAATTAIPPTTTTTTAPADVSSVAADVQPATPIVLSGNLQQPDDASASSAFTGAGSMQVSVSSTSSVPLLLTVTCPSGTFDQAGSSSFAVVIPNADGPCDLVLKETVVQYVAVPYTVTIGPEGG